MRRCDPNPRTVPRASTRAPRSAPLAIALLLTLVALAAPSIVQAQSDATVVYLVRHSERAEDGTNDPPISPAGQARSDLLAEMLRDAEITHIHTTDYKRTRATGAPTAQVTGLEMQLYDPGDLASFADHLRSVPGRHLVLGHSNTTPQLVEALGGDPGTPIEEMEYDRFYIVTIQGSDVSTVLLRFGQRFEG